MPTKLFLDMDPEDLKTDMFLYRFTCIKRNDEFDLFSVAPNPFLAVSSLVSTQGQIDITLVHQCPLYQFTGIPPEFKKQEQPFEILEKNTYVLLVNILGEDIFNGAILYHRTCRSTLNPEIVNVVPISGFAVNWWSMIEVTDQDLILS